MDISVFQKKKKHMTIFLVIVIGLTLLSARMTDFNFVHSIQTLPKAFSWMVSNLVITEQALSENAIHYG